MSKQGQSSQTDNGGTPRHSAFVDRRWQLLAFLFLVAGAAGIPAIWASRAFSVPAKTALTVAVSLYTLAMLVLLALAVIWTWQQMLTILA